MRSEVVPRFVGLQFPIWNVREPEPCFSTGSVQIPLRTFGRSRGWATSTPGRGISTPSRISCWGGVGVDFQLLMAAVDGVEEGISDSSRKIPESPVKHKTEVTVGQAILGLVESRHDRQRCRDTSEERCDHR